MRQLELELYPTNRDYIGAVIREDPYVKILGPIEYSMHWDSLVAVAQVEGSICIVSVKERNANSEMSVVPNAAVANARHPLIAPSHQR